MWIIYDIQTQEIEVVDDYQKALEIYQEFKNDAYDYVADEGGFSLDESIYFAKVEKHYHPYKTDEKRVLWDKDGNEVEIDEFLWDWKEDSY